MHEQGEMGPQGLNTLPTPTTQTTNPENNDPGKIESHSEAALRQLKTLIEQGADQAAINRAKEIVYETVKIEQENNANDAREDIANLAGDDVEQSATPTASHLETPTPTHHLRPAAPTMRMIPPKPARPASRYQTQGPGLAEQVRRINGGSQS